MGYHGQLLTQCQVFKVEPRVAPKEAEKGYEQWKQGCFHARDATERDSKKSTESIRTRFTIGTGIHLGNYWLFPPAGPVLTGRRNAGKMLPT